MAPQAASIFSLEGKTAFVTGASQGLGQQFAKWLAAEGAKVVLAARQTSALEEVAEEIKKEGGEAKVVSLDLTNDDSIFSAIEAGWTAFDGGVDIVVNNSGIVNPGSCTDVSLEAFDDVIKVNFRGAFVIAREFAKRMIDAGKSNCSIINISSAAGSVVLNNAVGYNCTKAAMDHMTRSMSRELAHKGIRVNSLAPGYFVTAINSSYLNSPQGDAMAATLPSRRFGKIETELRGPLLLLASDAGSYMTGSVLTVDGGVSTGTMTSF